MATQDPNPLSVYYMEDVLEERPVKSVRLGPRIGSRFLPIQSYNAYRIVWEKVRDYSPMAGLYAMEELPDTMDTLDFETFQSDVLHWAARMTLTAKEIMFLRWAGDSNIANADTGYGVGPAADDYRRKDADKIAEFTRMMNEAMVNVLEILQMHSLYGQIYWPPLDENGAVIPAANLPLSMGRMKLNHVVPFLAAAGGSGGFHQAASALLGINGGPTGHNIAWNVADTNVVATDANPIYDMSIIADLMDDRMNLSSDQLTMITSKRVIHYMHRNVNIMDYILGTTRDRTFLNVNEVRDFFATQFGFTIEYYQSKWEYVDQDALADNKPPINQVPFLPYGTVLIVPNPEIQDLGVTATCPAPGPAHNWRDGKYFWIERDEKPPWKTDMGIGAFYWPLIFDTDVRFRLDAWQ